MSTNMLGKRKRATSKRDSARRILKALKSGRTMTKAPLATRGFYGLYTNAGRQELKYTDVSLNNSTIPTTGVVALLQNVPAGTDVNERVGRKITNKSILFRIQAYTESTALSGAAVRIMLIYDSQTNSAGVNVTDVLQFAQPLSPMNLNNRDRFKVLKDWYFGTDAIVYTGGPPGTAITVGTGGTYVKKTYRRLNHDTIFSATGNTIGSISTGAILLLLVTDVANAVGCSYYSRIRYSDA